MLMQLSSNSHVQRRLLKSLQVPQNFTDQLPQMMTSYLHAIITCEGVKVIMLCSYLLGINAQCHSSFILPASEKIDRGVNSLSIHAQC